MVLRPIRCSADTAAMRAQRARFVANRCWRDSCDLSSGFRLKSTRRKPRPSNRTLDNCWEHIRAVSAVLRRHRPRGGRRVDRSIADTACSSKPLCGPMGIEWVNGAKGGGAGEGKCNELRRWSAIGRRKERWHGVAGEVMRSRPKGSGHTAAEADMTAGFVLVEGSRCSSSSS